MFERFNVRARRVLVLARDQARRGNHDHIGPEHLLLGLLQEGDGVGAHALAGLGVSLTSAMAVVDEVVGRGTAPPTDTPPFTPRAKLALELSLREAIRLGHNYIGTEHLLLGLVRESERVPNQVLTTLGLDPAAVDAEVMALLGGMPGRRHPLDAVAGDDVEPAEAVDVAQLLPPGEAFEILIAALASQPSTDRTEVHGVAYDTCAYRPEPLPEILVSVAAAEVSREAFDGFTEQLPEATPIEGLGDAATYDPDTSALRMLVGTTLVVVQVRHHEERQRIAVDVARRVLASLAAPGA